MLEAQEPSREEEAETRKQKGAEEDKDGWVDEEAGEGVDVEAEVQDETIAQRVKNRGTRKRATRTLPGGGG
jgi:hypothetical protein